MDGCSVVGAWRLQVTLVDHSTYTAKLVGFDAAKDIAVLRLSVPKSKLRELRPVALGSSSALQVRACHMPQHRGSPRACSVARSSLHVPCAAGGFLLRRWLLV